MSSFKKRLSDAINSVFDDLEALSIDELKVKVDRHLDYKMTEAVYDSWHSFPAASHFPEIADEWRSVSLDVCNSEKSSKGFPNLFEDENASLNQLSTDEHYSRHITSDDYYLFRAAA